MLLGIPSSLSRQIRVTRRSLYRVFTYVFLTGTSVISLEQTSESTCSYSSSETLTQCDIGSRYLLDFTLYPSSLILYEFHSS